MLRTSIIKSVSSKRLLSTSARLMAGETGSGFSRPAGDKAGDAFTRRERANEEMYIRQEEKQKLLAIRAKLAEQRKHIDELDKHIEDLTKDHGGEQH
ncbi:hypothetical protein GQ43DRAFT_436485 [Delitschia confertaspora ATCC 74209]|uniref:ATPase inhibitor, mitochondrial n=1 Tax=Delitschia confertaspora ATCC 74209 TaxID=1513339 RepID=A0A9P4JUJ4_9PLEO|nr:hypothetical protein GQ43DRAFT_436485 [Delitschia confertaspora ATCC 74209]